MPAYTVSCVYQRELDSVDSEQTDFCDVLSAIRTWSEDAGITFAPRFNDPDIQAAQWELLQRLGKESGLMARLKRWIRNEEWSPEDIIRQQLELAGRGGVHRSDFECDKHFAAAAIEALDRNAREIYVEGGRASNSLTIAVWKKSWGRFWCSMNLYRFDDKALVLQVQLLSTEAYDNRELQEVGNELLAKLERMGKFLRDR